MTQNKIPLAEFSKMIPEEDEIKQLEVLKVTEVSLREFLLQNHGNISATGEPNLMIYGGVRFGEEWFAEIMEKLSA